MKSNRNSNGYYRSEVSGIGIAQTDPTASADSRFHENLVFDAEELEAPATVPTQKRAGRRRKLIIGATLLLLLAASVVVALYSTFGGSRTPLNLKVRDTQTESKTQARQNPEDVTSQAIAEVRSATPEVSSPVSPPMAATGTARVSPTAPVTVPITGIGGTLTPPQPAADVQTAKPTGASSATRTDVTEATSSGSPSPASRRSPERSIRCALPVASTTPPSNMDAARNPKRQVEKDVPAFSKPTGSGVVLPAFGAMLPVRLLGSLYTLRPGSLARFELTRDVRGAGWAMKKGTVLIGANRGGEYDRAYVAIVGFIDPESGRLVKLTGDVLGGDGGAGLRGRRRQLSSAWSRAFSRIGASAVNVAGLAASGLGRNSVVISDAYGYRVANPVTSELNSLISDRANGPPRGFVEVAAGTQGYVMVTDLPAEIQGVDALTELSAKDLAERADASGVRASTGLSERELSELLSSGSVEQIRAALPRMTPEMRRIAETVIAESGN